MLEIFKSYTYKLKNHEGTKICKYCGQPVSEELMSIECKKYSCSCKYWKLNVEPHFKEELYNEKKELELKELEKLYDPSIHGTHAEYYLYCISKVNGWHKERDELKKKIIRRMELKKKGIGEINKSLKVTRNKTATIEGKKKKKSHAIRVEVIETGECFPSIYACAKYFNVSYSIIKKNEHGLYRFYK